MILYLENNDSIHNFFSRIFKEYNFDYYHVNHLSHLENYLIANCDLKQNYTFITNALVENKDMFSYSLYIKRKFQIDFSVISYTDSHIIDNSIRAKQSGVDYFFPLPVLPYDIIQSIHDINLKHNHNNVINDKNSDNKPRYDILPNNKKGISSIFKEYLDEYFSVHSDIPPSSGLYERIMNEIEPQIILSSLHYTHGNRIKAADILGINRNTLRKKMLNHKIDFTDDVQ